MALTATSLGFNIPMGPGIPLTYTGTDPAANTNISDTVPNGKVWRVLAVKFSLATDANVANRVVHLRFTDGTNTLLDLSPGLTQAASKTGVYSWAIGLDPKGPDVGDRYHAPLPSGFVLGPGSVISTVTNALQATDDFSAAVYYVEEWDA